MSSRSSVDFAVSSFGAVHRRDLKGSQIIRQGDTMRGCREPGLDPSAKTQSTKRDGGKIISFSSSSPPFPNLAFVLTPPSSEVPPKSFTLMPESIQTRTGPVLRMHQIGDDEKEGQSNQNSPGETSTSSLATQRGISPSDVRSCWCPKDESLFCLPVLIF